MREYEITTACASAMPRIPAHERVDAIPPPAMSTSGNARSRLPIVALTDSAIFSDRQRCLKAGMDADASWRFKRAQLIAVLDQGSGGNERERHASVCAVVQRYSGRRVPGISPAGGGRRKKMLTVVLTALQMLNAAVHLPPANCTPAGSLCRDSQFDLPLPQAEGCAQRAAGSRVASNANAASALVNGTRGVV